MRQLRDGLSVDLGDEWTDEDRVDPSIHGYFLVHRPSGSVVQLRKWHRTGDPDWVRAELLSQNWPPPARDLVERRVGNVFIAGATWGPLGDAFGPTPRNMREWFASDGVHAANASLFHVIETPSSVIDACERFLDTLRF